MSLYLLLLFLSIAATSAVMAVKVYYTLRLARVATRPSQAFGDERDT